ncbi:DUF86 domain-containing protein [Okeania sp. SIO2B3]|uniref:HepT-like ribonuclease domain-containing protein n=1 Tax=Okeania sp. SIO2B3 TaxID=2607784 RepID=UPI0013C1ABE4|nr:DUF86 domain-containing protein [Okeania sp. SIO2B3]NET46779.1 DUF86 domain-containing protein [Okeania sp. SIO2B3]
MQNNDRDIPSVWDMVQAIRRIQEFTTGLTYNEYLQSVLIQSAVERQFEILGEAARRISLEFQQLHSQINWRSLIGLRNIIAHRYDQVRPEILWGVITSNIPSLLEQLEVLLPPLTDE